MGDVGRHPPPKGDGSMPYMRVSLTKKLTEEEKHELYGKLGQALALIPGKEAFMLIADIEDGREIYCGGKKQDNFAFVDARYFSRFEFHIKKAFAQGVMAAIGEIAGTPKECISMTISEFSTWAGFGDLADEYYKDDTQ